MAGNLSALALGGSTPTKAIVNYFSSGGVNVGTATPTNYVSGKEVLSGALTANTLATLLTVSQPGQLIVLSAYTKDATARTIRLQVIVDGTTVFDATTNSISAVNTGLIAAGSYGAAPGVFPGPGIRFNSSCVVKVASSLTETDKVAIAYSLV